MMSNLKPYPDYKPSNVEWLGDVPAHWEVRRVKQVSWIQGGFAFSADSFGKEGVPVVRMNNIRRGVLALDDVVRIPEHQCKDAFALKEGDIIYGLSGSIGATGSLGNYAVVRKDDIPAQLNQRVARFRPVMGRITEGFLVRSIQIRVFYDQVLSHTTGTAQFNVSTNDISNVALALPPVEEQRRVVCYLDLADERIRRYVRSRERLIELLEEYRQAVIHHAVTRGLDPDVRLKSSDVEWLGDVPAHWEVRRLRNVGEAIIGLTYDPQDVVDEEDGILVLRASNISNGRIVYGDNVYVRCSVPDRLITKVGDILICSRSGSRALIGKNVRIDSSSSGVTFGAFMTVFRCANNEYLRYVFNSKLFEYQSGAFMTSTINQLTLSMLYSIKIPLPPVPEQKRIIHYLEKATADVDVAIDRARREIELLGEYRTRLIADVVTGIVDVREVAAELPDEVE
ncbi:MAG: hypothetical protein F4Y39_07515 [Gemmatimonadetes bacterium]|nr:hypothetical protein [Gemmatimonadota bacterium]MYK53516.1 hypothetical protein [Gemmatimonadota bacterium]